MLQEQYFTFARARIMRGSINLGEGIRGYRETEICGEGETPRAWLCLYKIFSSRTVFNVDKYWILLLYFSRH